MTDDPHDATWIQHPTKINWCAKCQDHMESCECYREGGPVGLVLAIFVGIIVVLIAAALMVS